MSSRRSITLFRLLLAIIVLLVVNLQAAAQPDGPQPPPLDEGQSGQPETPGRPEKMTFQPAANANSFEDFVPPRAFVVRGNVVAQEVAAFDQESLGEARAAFHSQTIPMRAQTDVAVPLADDRLNIIVEKDTFAEQTSLEVRSIAALAADKAGSAGTNNTPFMRFELEMLNEQQQPIPSFSKYVRLVVDLREYNIDLDRDGGYFYLAYEDENEPGKWREVPVTYHGRNGLISAEVAHFSNWQAGWRPEAWALEWRPPSVNEFTGAAAYQYPIQVPPGRNGLQPNVGLSYSSASLRGAIQKVSYGNVATGWSLSDISITRTGIKNGIYSWTYPDKFRLTINGVGGRLISTGTEGEATVYRVEDYPQFKVYNYGGRTWNANQSGNSYWVVQSGDGIYYRLGYTTDSVSYQGTHLLNQPFENELIAWHVDTITDSYGNQITYDYSYSPEPRHEEWGFWAPEGNSTWTVETYNSQVDEIAYNFTARIQTLPPAHDVPRLTSSPASRILFKYENEEYRLTAIEVQHGNVAYPSRRYEIEATTESNQNPSKCDEFRLEYNRWDTLYSSTRVINSITEQAIDPANGNVISQLPKTTFTYQTLNHFVQQGQACFLYEYLATVDNGYGGQSTFTYESDNRTEGDFNNCKDWVPEYDTSDPDNPILLNPCDQQWPNMGYNYSVKTITHSDGFNPGVKTQYNYSGRCYDQHNSNAISCPQPDTDGDVEFGNIGGYNQVEAVTYDYDGTTPLRRQTTYFHHDQDGTTNGADKYGKPYLTELRDGSGTLLQSTDTAYVVSSFANNVRFTYTSAITSTQYNGSNSIYTKVNNFYETSFQGDQQWGQLTRQDTFYLNPDGQEELANHQITRFVTNETDWLILPWVTGTYDAQWQPKQVTLYEYDDNSNDPDTQSLDIGELTRTRVLLVDNPTVNSNLKIFNSIDTLYDYDEFGNQKEITTYTDYGQAGNDGVNWNYSVPPDNSTARTTTIGYDSPYKLYPISTSGPAPDYAINFEVYGFNGVGLDGYQKQPGLLKQVIDANGLSSIYEYDPFGRLFATYEPGDSRGTVSDPWDGDPAKRIRYWDNNWNASSSSPFTWGGPIDSSILPGSGSIQAQTAYVVGDKLYQDIWQNNQAWTRAVDIVEGSPDWGNTPAFVKTYTTLPPGTGEIQSASYYVLGGKLYQGIWQGGEAWTRAVNIVAGTPDWGNAPAFGGPYAVELPGTGEIQSQTAYILDDVLYQGMWQGNQGFSRTVPIDGGAPVWGEASGWSNPIPATSMPGQGDIQAQAAYVIGDVLSQGFWRGDAGYARSIPIVDGQPQWRQYLPFHVTEQTRPQDYPDPDLTGVGSSTLDTITFYDGFGRPVQTRQRYANVDTLGQRDIVSLTEYDALGQVQCATTPFAISTAPGGFSGDCTAYPHTLNYYDALGRPEKIVAPDGSESIYHYGIDNYVRFEDLTNSNRQRIQNRYDALGRLVQVDEIEGNCGDYWASEGFGCGGNYTSLWGVYATTHYSYDVFDNLTSVTQSPEGTTNFTTTMTYDALGRKLTMDDPDMGSWTYQYDAASHMIRQEANATEPEGVSLCFYYNEFDELVRSAKSTSATAACPASFDSAPAAGGNHLATYVYGDTNPNWGRLQEINWGDSPAQNKDVFTYDSLGRVTLQKRYLDGRLYALQTIQFDSLNRPTQTRLQYPGGQDDVVTIDYDREGANTLTLGIISLVSDMRFNVNGQLARLVRNSNVPETIYEYYDATSNTSWAGDSNFRMSSIQHQQGGTTLLDFTYHYDAGGNIEQIDSHADGNTDTQTFTYDDLNRLTSVSGSYARDYAYDRIGNMTQSDGHDLGYGQAMGVAPGAKPHAVTHYDGNQWFTYDAHGNMVSRQDDNRTFTQVFDAQNRLEQVIESGGSTTQFFYDASGQRVKTIKPSGAIIYTPFPNLEEEVWPASTTAPSINLTANGQTALQLAPNAEYTLEWDSTAVRCEAEGDWSGTKATGGSQTFSGFTSGTRSYSLTCYNSSASQTVTVTVEVPPVPVVSMTVNSQSSLAILPNTSFTLAWNSTGANSCDLSWSGSQATSGSQTISGLAAGSYTYSITCQNGAGSNSDSVTVTVMPTPTVDLTANYQSSLTIAPNTSFTLRWTALDAASCTASGNWSGSKASSGSQNFTSPGPNSTRTYTLTCTNAVGSTVDSVTVTVPPLPTVSLTADYGTDLWILPNTAFTLRWSTSGADSCTASGSWSGSKSLNGSQTISGFSSGSRAYTLSCTNNVSGDTTRSVSVSIMPEIQSQSAYVIDNQLYQGFWRNDKGWSRTVPIVNGQAQWSSASAWDGPISITILPGSGTVQAQTAYQLGDQLYQSLWRGNQGWTRIVPIVNGIPNWNGASAWSGPISINGMPGSGDMQAQSSYVLGDTLYQGFWRNNQGYSRSAPIVNNVVQWGSATAWSGPFAITTLPGSGDEQTQTGVVVGDTLHQGLWRGHQGWERTVPVVNGSIDWGAASAWSGPMDYSILPGGPSGNESAQVNNIIVAEAKPFNKTTANVLTLLTFLVGMTVMAPLFPSERRSAMRRWLSLVGTWLPGNIKLYKSVLWQALMVLVVIGMLFSLVGLANLSGTGKAFTASMNEPAAEPNEPILAANSGGGLEDKAASVALGPVQSPWVSADIGSVGLAGSADETSGTYTIDGAGANIAGTVDAFHFVYQPLSGDGSITANAVSLSGGGTTPRMGLMMRDSLADDAAHVAAVVQGNRIRVLDRASSGVDTTDVAGYTMGAPEWLRLERSGNTFTLSHSNDGVSWTVMQTRTITMGTTIYVGMAVTGNSTTTLATGVFDNVSVTGGGGGTTATPTVSPTPTATAVGPTITPTPTATNTPQPSPTPAPGSEVVIRRVTFSMAGQVVAVKVSGDPNETNNGLFYVYSDHLGSTTAMTNENGVQVGSITRFDPFGNYRTGGANEITDLGFTGHKHNDDIGLIYMNARYYVPTLNRFASADTIVPNPANPQSFNRYSYVKNNPIVFTDPSGHIGCQALGTEECATDPDGNFTDDYVDSSSPDLTSWLVSEMVSHAAAPELSLMRQIINLQKNHLPTNGPHILWGYFESAMYAGQLAGPFYQLNKGFGRWDVKRNIQWQIGIAVTLCGRNSCDWFDYSTPGNILYGFTAASVGVPLKVSQWAGGALEIKEGTVNWANWQTTFEDPQDLAAVQFGYYLFDTYGPDITVDEFQEAFTVDVQIQLQKPPSGFVPRNPAMPGQEEYSVGYFNYVEE